MAFRFLLTSVPVAALPVRTEREEDLFSTVQFDCDWYLTWKNDLSIMFPMISRNLGRSCLPYTSSSVIVTRFLSCSLTYSIEFFIKQVLVKPMVRGFKLMGLRLIPGPMFKYYKEVLVTKRVFKIISPLTPALSSYAYSKFEQGVFWSLKRSWRFAIDNFIEFEEIR